MLGFSGRNNALFGVIVLVFPKKVVVPIMIAGQENSSMNLS